MAPRISGGPSRCAEPALPSAVVARLRSSTGRTSCPTVALRTDHVESLRILLRIRPGDR